VDAGGLMAMCGAGFMLTAFVVHWKTGVLLVSLLAGLPIAFIPIAFRSVQAQQAFQGL